MKAIHLGAVVFSCVSLLMTCTSPAKAADVPARSRLRGGTVARQELSFLNGTPALFVANSGQWSRRAGSDGGAIGPIRFAYQSKRASVLLTDGAIAFVPSSRSQCGMIGVTFPGAQPVRPIGLGESSAAFNYCIGSDPDVWHTSVPAYEKVIYHDLYAGIDLVIGVQDRHLKYEFHVAPAAGGQGGGDWRRIRIAYEGIESLRLGADGRLHINTLLGELVDDAPFIYQERNGTRIPVSGKFQLLDESSYTIAVTGAYDAKAPLVIDPYLAWSTFYGGSTGPISFPGYDVANGIAADSSGNVFIAGETWSADLPVPGGAYKALPGEGDAYVAKFNAKGALVWATFLGGSDLDIGHALACDSSGNVYVAGWSYSTNFPTPNGRDRTFNGYVDGFVAKLTSGGTLSWSTYLGGTSGDSCWGVATDGSAVYVTGETTGTDFPTRDAYDNSYNYGGIDAFVTKFSSTGSLDWSTYFGGSGAETGYTIVVDSAAVYLTGVTNSTDFPVQDAAQSSRGGLTDAFLTKFDKEGSLTWSTYLGGTLEESGDGVTVDGSGNVYLCGQTMSDDFPALHGGDTTLNGTSDAFVAKFASTGSLSWATYLGGRNGETCQGIVVDASGIYVAGGATSDNFPATSSAYDTTYNGNGDAFLAKYNTSGSLSYATYFGGTQADSACGIALVPSSAVYVGGTTASANLPAPAGWDKTFNGGTYDAFVARFSHNQWTLTVRSSPFSGISITGSPAGITQYTPLCTDITVASIAAPTSLIHAASYYVFIKWARDGASQPPGRRILTMTMTKDTDAKAYYKVFRRLRITGPSTVYEKSSANYICRVYLTDGTYYNITSYATWKDSSSYATIDRYGKLKTASVPADRTVRITASYAGKSCYVYVRIRNR